MAIIVALVSIFLGFVFSTPIPEGTLFAIIFPLTKGYTPAAIFGDPSEPRIKPVPEDLVPQPRPNGEMFLTLPSGAKMPANGIGMCCRYSAYDFESVRHTVLWYLLKGGRLIDTAQLYLNHRGVGAGIKDAIARGIPREEIFVTTKLSPRFYSGTKKELFTTIEEFLEELGLEYLDLVLLHHPEGLPGCHCKNGTAPECRANAWIQLSEVQKTGAVRDLGVSNFVIRQIEELSSLQLSPVAVNQIQYNPWAPDWQQEVVDHCQQNGVAITAWGSFQGTLMQNAAMFTVETLRELASAKDVSVPQLILRWALQKGVSVIPGTGNPKHMADNLAVFDFELDEDDMKKLDNIRSDPKAKDFTAYGFDQNAS